MRNWIIQNGTVLRSAGFEAASINISDGLVSEDTTADCREFDARDCYVLPGIVDVHGDGFERIMEPRPGVIFDKEIALREADRQLVSNGVTTAFHGVGVSWEPGVRDMSNSRAFVETWARLKNTLGCDMHLNLRWETYSIDERIEALEWLKKFPGTVLSVNDHATAFKGLDADHPRVIRMAKRIGISAQDASALLDRVFSRSDEVPAAIQDMCTKATAMGARVFAHDETSIEQREYHRGIGMSVSEFPMTAETARSAVKNGEHVVLGAPNVVRGGSQNNALCATAAIEQGICTVLASDYYYPAQRIAAFKLVDEGVLKLENAWKIVSTNPAQSVGLDDRGTLEPGKRGDLVVIETNSREVRAVFSAGKKVYERVH